MLSTHPGDMKAVLGVLTLCGFLLTVESACDANACPKPMPPSCSSLKSFIDCLKGQLVGCTSSQAAEKAVIQGLITASEATRKAMGCSILLTLESACDANACPKPVPPSCSSLKSFIDCLKGQLVGCTSSQAAEKAVIQGLITASEATRKAMGCSLLMTVESACDSNACPKPVPPSCSSLKSFIDCLEGQLAKCTSSQAAEKADIQGLITVSEATRKAMGCSWNMSPWELLKINIKL